ncbi:MAG: hypothetical protein IPP66_09005 [Anaerolineales bacterium]|nr:hypothetical protein [Anaerolineales bacterium]
MKNNPETIEVRRIISELHKIQQLALDSNLIIISRDKVSPQVVTQQIQQETNAVEKLIKALSSDWFLSVKGYFANHRQNSSYAKIIDEYQVQDLVYCLAVSMMPDLQYEDPQQKNIGALTSTRIDFYSLQHKLYLEIKFANNNHQAKKVEAEISEDVFKYGKQTIFDTLIFFIYCAEDYNFPSPREFERGNTGIQNIMGHQFSICCIVKP